ncbi:MAG: hypothetical protein ABIR06_09300 [Cyclobacteriaceae bacterium]
MFVPFASLSPESRIWIYQADRQMTSAELGVMKSKLQEFTEGWVAHGVPLKTSFTIEFNQFIILAADEDHQSPSGCSIDGSVRVLKELEQLTGIRLFDRNLVAFKIDGKIILIPVDQLKLKFAEGALNASTLSFNNLVSSKGQFHEGWLQPAGKTWLKRYIPEDMVKMK